MSEAADDYEIEPMKYVGSTIGNAFFSGLTMEQLFECVCIADDENSAEALDAAVQDKIHQALESPKTLDAAVSARIRMNELMEKSL